ncbi:MAG: NADH:flavin oxidoreductase/NADH oxidase [Pseudolabrys sp.]|nr:NADH:flavin oxidoreductase/NADH oxidase [Pseudolabrys sp.]MBV9260770.1 NADH:flavin oxidoreductase/NADH oxidase [Pseudolabrys sp.]
MTSALFSPIKLAGLELPNRIVVSPMCQYSADDGSATDWHMMHLGMLANSGAGMVVVEATGVERGGRITHGCLGLYSDDNESALTRIIQQCRLRGTTKFGIQLAHAGRKASANLPWDGATALKNGGDPWPTVAASGLPFGEGWHIPAMAGDAEMARIRDAFVASAKRAVRIGFDSIELHMAHGYLLHSFMSPLSNTRNDGYGGPLANRMKFPIEVTRAVRAVVPKNIALGARMTGSDWKDGGLTPDDAVAIAKALKEAGLDFVCISSGGLTADTRTPTDPGYNVPIAEKVRKEAGIPVRVVGMIVTPKQAEGVVGQGKADMVTMARAFLDDPHWAWHAAKELGADVPRPKQYLRTGPKFWPPAAASA